MNPNIGTGSDKGLSPRWLSYVSLELVVPAERNGGRKHDLDALTASIREFGFTAPLIVDERTGRLIAGHGRLAALVGMYERAEAPPAGIVVDHTFAWHVPVLRGWSSTDDTQAIALLLADNKLTENAQWNDWGLAELLEEVVTSGGSLLDATGFTADDLDELLRTVTPERLGEQDPDQITHLPDVTDPLDGEQTIDTAATIGQDSDRPLDGDDDEGTSADEPTTTCPACAHTWVRDPDRLTVIGSDEPMSVGDILRYGSGVILSRDDL